MLQMGGQPVWRVVMGGSRRYVQKITRGMEDRIHLNTGVRHIERGADHVRLVDAGGNEGTFDHVVVACHADQALAMLADPTPVERELLGMFPYQTNDIVLHTDASVLPQNRRAWSSWNYHVPAEARDAVSVTYNMNRLQNLVAASPINVTLNDAGAVADEHVLGRFVYEHPVFIPGRDTAQRRHRELAAAHRTSFCGAYWGFGFHEDGVRSGAAVARAIEERAAR
jgi:predicted NAD/FAD-binding protein